MLSVSLTLEVMIQCKEMQPLKKRANELLADITADCDSLHINAKSEELEAIDAQLADANVWANLERAQNLSRQ